MRESGHFHQSMNVPWCHGENVNSQHVWGKEDIVLLLMLILAANGLIILQRLLSLFVISLFYGAQNSVVLTWKAASTLGILRYWFFSLYLLKLRCWFTVILLFGLYRWLWMPQVRMCIRGRRADKVAKVYSDSVRRKTKWKNEMITLISEFFVDSFAHWGRCDKSTNRGSSSSCSDLLPLFTSALGMSSPVLAYLFFLLSE